MGNKYFDTKDETLESSILGVWTEAAKKVAETNKNNKSDDGEGLDAVQPKAVKKKFADRKDKDIDNDGDTDDSDEYLHNRRKTVSKAVKGKVKEETDLDENKQTAQYTDGGQEKVTVTVDGMRKVNIDNVITKNLKPGWEKVKKKSGGIGAGRGGRDRSIKDEGNAFGMALKAAKDKGEKTFVVAGKTYEVKEGFAVPEDVPAMEVGTDRYREYASDLTPGETDPEWVQARDFKVASMKEALAKVWGLDEKVLDKSSKEEYDEEDEELKPVKGSKTMTGGKVAKVDTKPKIDG